MGFPCLRTTHSLNVVHYLKMTELKDKYYLHDKKYSQIIESELN